MNKHDKGTMVADRRTVGQGEPKTGQNPKFRFSKNVFFFCEIERSYIGHHVTEFA